MWDGASPGEPALILSNGDGTDCSPARQCRVAFVQEMSPEGTAQRPARLPTIAACEEGMIALN
jgi:hypothetical protein